MFSTENLQYLWNRDGQDKTNVTIDDQQEVAYAVRALIGAKINLYDLQGHTRSYVSKHMRLSERTMKTGIKIGLAVSDEVTKM